MTVARRREFDRELADLNARYQDVPPTERCFSVLVVALAIADAHTANGTTEHTFVECARAVHRRIRAALKTGASA